MKKFIFIILVVILATMTISCNKKVDDEIVEPEPQPVEEPVEDEPEEEVFSYVSPLTGLGTNETIDHRPFGVMIENSTSARPQSGLIQADIVYEVLSEGSITRFLALFHSEKPDKIGPVRSARDYYIRLNNGYNGIYVSAGWSPAAQKMIQTGQADHVNGLVYDGKYFQRSSDRKAPHNLYTSYENLVAGANQSKISLSGSIPTLPFLDEEEIPSGQGMMDIVIEYGSNSNQVSYKYDADTEQFLRFNGGEQTVDKETNTAVRLDNVFVVEANHRLIPGDSSGRREIDVSSGGKGILFQKGTAIEVEWENVNGQILPMINGSKVSFVRGKTWINLVSSLDHVTFQ